MVAHEFMRAIAVVALCMVLHGQLSESLPVAAGAIVVAIATLSIHRAGIHHTVTATVVRILALLSRLVACRQEQSFQWHTLCAVFTAIAWCLIVATTDADVDADAQAEDHGGDNPHGHHVVL